MFCGHAGAEKRVCLVSLWLLSPDFEGIVEESSVADIIVGGEEAESRRLFHCLRWQIHGHHEVEDRDLQLVWEGSIHWAVMRA